MYNYGVAMFERDLQHMYQQWQQGNTDATHGWMVFVDMVCKVNQISQHQLIEQLEKYKWFKKSD